VNTGRPTENDFSERSTIREPGIEEQSKISTTKLIVTERSRMGLIDSTFAFLFVYPFFAIPITLFFVAGGFGTVREALIFSGLITLLFFIPGAS